MANILKGAPVVQSIAQKTKTLVEELEKKGVTPTLAILRVGERPDDISYEKSASKKCADFGVKVKNVVLPEDTSSEAFFDTLESLNNDKEVHGILMFRPLPKHIDSERARNMIAPEKDVDGCTDASLAGVFTDSGVGFSPCTAQAAIEILDYYGIETAGKKAAVMGRSLVVGRPAAMLLMHKNATVTICHSKTPDAPAQCAQADIVIACIGKSEMMGKEYFSEGQSVIDVGINFDPVKNKLCGDVKFDEAEPVVGNITPVPGGVGAVTTAVLVSHVAQAAMKNLKNC